MIGLVRGLSALALSLLLAPGARAACTSAECSDTAKIEAVRDQIAAACDCVGIKSHKKYTRCAKELVKAAIRDGRLSASCKKTVTRCEAQSTCGVRNASVCCLMKDGTPKARMMKKRGKCKGTPCSGAFALADACTAEGACAKPRSRGVRAFRTVQQVFTQSCALPSCHSTFARQGGLVLDSEDVSYISLIDRPSAHPDANKAGLLRVKSGDPGNSYLIKKLRGEGPGDVMPQSGGKLAEPIIKMVEDWIRRGAHSTAEECPARATGEFTPRHGATVPTICDDEAPPIGNYVWEPLPALDVPETGKGIQLYTPPRDVAPGTEWETCYAFKPDWRKIRAEIGLPPAPYPITFKQQIYRMHPGSHHLLVYGYLGTHPEGWKLGEYFPCFAGNPLNDGDGPSDSSVSIPIGGTQVAGTRYEVTYPQGVGIPVFNDDMVIIANLHYTNPFQPAQPIYGEAWLNLNFHAPDEFKVLLDGIFGINAGDLFVEPFTSRTISRIWKPTGLLTRAPANAAVFQLFGHMHKRGVEFRIDKVSDGKCSANQALCGRDGDCPAGQTCVQGPNHEDSTIYYTTLWDQAPIMNFLKPYFRVNKDEGLRWTCTHTNGVQGDETRPPKRCRSGCRVCGWDEAAQQCVFNPRRFLGPGAPIRYYNDGDPMPLVFGELADDDMCNMFGYFVLQESVAQLP